MYEVRNIAFSYGDTPVLRDVSFMVSPGEAVAVVGANGAGKTTLMRVLSTLAVPTSGRVMIDGQDALMRPLRYLRQLGYLPENPSLYDDMSVKDYLTYRAQLKGELPKRIRRRVGEALEVCMLTDSRNRPLRLLSAGLRKRTALADAILLRPRVLLLDDFLAGIDRTMREAFEAIVPAVAAFSSVIATGHELEDLARWATRFLVLRNGVISAEISTAGMERMAAVKAVESAMKGEILK